MLFVILFFVPQVTLAESSSIDLDESFKQFRMDYEKEENSAQLAQVELPEVSERKIIIKLDEHEDFDSSKLGVQYVDEITTQMFVVQVFSEDDYAVKLDELQQLPGVIYAEPDYKLETTFMPQDPLLEEQWYLEQIGMKQAWDITRGSSDVTIAVLDSGVNANHPDLKGRVLKGYNFIKNNNDASDDNGHGTHIAGIIAANANQIGISGIDHSAKILPLKVFCDKGSGSISNAIKGIYYAIDQGVDVINMSYVSKEKNKAEEEALWKAHENGIVLVAASGNEGRLRNLYPASYSQVISVAATNEKDQRAFFSNYGNWVDLSAPGKDIYSTNYHGGYGIQSGTSFSAPVVSALAALLKSKNPQWTPNEIEWALEFGADPVIRGDSEWNYIFGFGRVNAYKALTAQSPLTEKNAGDVHTEAKVLDNGIGVREKMELPLDVDWFTFETTKRSEIKIELSNLPSHIDLVGALYYHNGKKIERRALIDKGKMGENETHKVEVGPGKYYLSVHDHYGRWSNYPYEVKVSQMVKTSFEDVKEYKKEISFLAEKGIIHGFQDGKFQPLRHVSRLQAVNIILREMGIDAKKLAAPNPGFTDIHRGKEGYEEVAAAVELGFIQGKLDNTFDPYGRLTRGQMASILVKAYKLQGVNASEFKDVHANHEAYDIVDRLAANGITTGYADGTFKPDTNVSRQHFALFMYRILNTD